MYTIDSLIEQYGSERKNGGKGYKDRERNNKITREMLKVAEKTKSYSKFVDEKIDLWDRDCIHKGCTRLHAAAMNGDLKMIKILIAKGANPEEKTQTGLNPMAFAAFHSHTDVMALLCRYGCAVDAYEFAQAGIFEAVKMLVEDDPSLLQAKDNSGYTLLHFAAGNGHTRVVQYLKRKGASISSKNNAGNTPLHTVAISGKSEMAKMLIAFGAQVDEEDDIGRTPLFNAAIYNKCGVAKVLLEHGADICHIDKNGLSIMDALLQCGGANNEVVDIILGYVN